MTLTRPRLLLLPGDPPLDPGRLEWLKEEFEVIEVDEAALPEALEDLTREPGPLLVCTPDMVRLLRQAFPPQAASAVLQYIGEGVGVVDAAGTITWKNARLAESDDDIRRHFAELCVRAVELFNASVGEQVSLVRRGSRKFSFRSGDRHFELVASPSAADPNDPRRIVSVVGVVWDVTTSRRLLDKLDAIDAAGSELMKIEAESISQLTMAERLKLLEDKIVHYVHDLLHFDNFEIRLLDKETSRLELVMAVGITPERVGEVIYPRVQGNGITGYVAATGESYLCPNVREDALYRPGLDDAASSLTVPLRLHDRTIGVFNIESKTLNAFDENDRQFATIFGRYVAMAINILDLLLVERYTTNENLARVVLGELSEPLSDLTKQVQALREESIGDGKMRKELERVVEAVESIRRRVTSCTSGPRTVLGAEQELHRDKVDPAMTGKRVLVADDNEEIRTSVCAILTRRGCDVSVCCDGGQTIAAIKAAGPERPFDLIISDIKMPDHSGYEVFRTAREMSPHTPVILMTGFGYDPHHSSVRASQEGLQSFLFKPFKAKQLINEAKKALKAKPAAPPQAPATTPHDP